MEDNNIAAKNLSTRMPMFLDGKLGFWLWMAWTQSSTSSESSCPLWKFNFQSILYPSYTGSPACWLAEGTCRGIYILWENALSSTIPNCSSISACPPAWLGAVTPGHPSGSALHWPTCTDLRQFPTVLHPFVSSHKADPMYKREHTRAV